MKFVNPKNDLALLDLKGNKEIQTIEILNPYQMPHLVDLKESSLDVRATDKRGVTFIVEMQWNENHFCDNGLASI